MGLRFDLLCDCATRTQPSGPAMASPHARWMEARLALRWDMSAMGCSPSIDRPD